jgi:hypothetical protein
MRATLAARATILHAQVRATTRRLVDEPVTPWPRALAAVTAAAPAAGLAVAQVGERSLVGGGFHEAAVLVGANVGILVAQVGR